MKVTFLTAITLTSCFAASLAFASAQNGPAANAAQQPTNPSSVLPTTGESTANVATSANPTQAANSANPGVTDAANLAAPTNNPTLASADSGDSDTAMSGATDANAQNNNMSGDNNNSVNQADKQTPMDNATGDDDMTPDAPTGEDY